MILIVEILLSVAIAGLIHEMGHYTAALIFGYRLSFKRHGVRFVWDMPQEADLGQQRVIALAGFGAEIIAALLIGWLLPLYPIVTVVHLLSYRFYSGDYNDFRWL
jgi:hypothetical protein